MSDKQVILEAIQKMPEDATFEQLREEIESLAALHRAGLAAHNGLPPVDRQMVAQSRAAIARGEGVPIQDLIRQISDHPSE